MSVTIPSDLVMDVMRAANPGRVKTAMLKLGASPAVAGMPGNFNAGLFRLEQATPAGAPRGPDAYAKFESFLLQSAFETMLPDAASGAYGDGFAGGVWRSMAADQFASIFTDHGGLGIAELLRQRAGQKAEAPEVATIAAGGGQWPYFHSAAITAFRS